jgi:hypothetical protein
MSFLNPLLLSSKLVQWIEERRGVNQPGEIELLSETLGSTLEKLVDHKSEITSLTFQAECPSLCENFIFVRTNDSICLAPLWLAGRHCTRLGLGLCRTCARLTQPI